jgi:hypothetical protein
MGIHPCNIATSRERRGRCGNQRVKMACGMTTLESRGFMGTAQRFLSKVLASWLLTLMAGPALAEYFSYQGQIQIQTAPGEGCAEVSPAPFTIAIYGRDDVPGQRIDGYLDGEKIVHAHFSGNYLNQLSLTYPGESSPSHTLRLRAAGDGSFAGELEAKSLLTALSGCKYSSAQIKFTKTATHTQAAYDQAASFFQMDSRAVQAYVKQEKPGFRGCQCGIKPQQSGGPFPLHGPIQQG